MDGELPRRDPQRRESDPLRWVRLLADEVGPRRPTSEAERRAAELLRQGLAERGVEPRLERFDGYSTFAAPYAAGAAAALAPALLPRRARVSRAALAAAAAAALASEGGLVHTPLSGALSRRPSQNLVATIEPAGEPRRTVCLLCHLDTSRSGLLFDPRFLPYLTRWLQLQSAATLIQAGEPLLVRSRVGRLVLGACRAVIAAGGALVAERELRGEDVPGANDNASGVAVAAELAIELGAEPLESTRVVLLATGCEEAGVLGAQAFLRSRPTDDWLFLNFDNIGGPATLRYLPEEGLARKWRADAALVAIAARLAAEWPELGLVPADGPIGLIYDATPVLARGGRALTLVAADDGVIPNYHWPTDTTTNLDPEAIERALAVGRELLAAIDRGEADT